MNNEERHNLSKSQMVEEIPLACSDELAAVELLEALRWGKNPTCVHCGSASVYKMTDVETGNRNKRYLWRCHDCHKQYTVRIGTVYEEISSRTSPLVLHILASSYFQKRRFGP